MHLDVDNSVAKRKEASVAQVQALLMPRAKWVYGFVERRIPAALASEIAPDDVLQEVWMAVFHGGHLAEVVRLGAIGGLDTWLLTVTRRKLVDAIKKFRRLQRGGGKKIDRCGAVGRSNSHWELLALMASSQRTPSSEEAAMEAATAIEKALSFLPEDYREVITLHHLEGLTQGDVAIIMQRSRPAVRGLLRRGMRALRQRMGASSQFFNESRSAPR